MRKVLEMQDSLLSASAISVLCVLARGQMRSLKSATVWPHGFALSPLPLCADLCTPTPPHLCIWDSPTTVPMDHEDEDVQCELHPLCTVLQYQPSKFCASSTWRCCQGGAEALAFTMPWSQFPRDGWVAALTSLLGRFRVIWEVLVACPDLLQGPLE